MKARTASERGKGINLIMVELKERRMREKMEGTRQLRDRIVTNIRMKTTDPSVNIHISEMPTDEKVISN